MKFGFRTLIKLSQRGIAEASMSLITKTALNISEADGNVVVGAQSNDHSAHLAGVPTERFFTDAATFVHVQLLTTKYYQFDTLSNFWLGIEIRRTQC